MGAASKTLYETDFVEWAQRTAELLRSGRLGEADLEHAAEEIEDLGRSQRAAVASQLQRMLMHLVKQADSARTRWRKLATFHRRGPRRGCIPLRRFTQPPPLRGRESPTDLSARRSRRAVLVEGALE